MGLVICPQHGESCLVFVSDGIAAAMWNDADPSTEPIMLRLESDGIVSEHMVDRAFCERNQAAVTIADRFAVATPGEVSFDLLCKLDSVCEFCFAGWAKRRTPILPPGPGQP